MKFLIIFFFAAVAGLAETPDEWFDSFYARSERLMRKRIEYIEANLPGDTTYRKLSEESLDGQMPLLRYLLKYYLAKDPGMLIWDKYGPFLQVLPCNCGKEGSIDSVEFRVLFPSYSKASSAWDEIDYQLRDKYEKLRQSMSLTEKERQEDEAELAALKERFLRLNRANQAPVPTPVPVTPAACAPVAPGTGAAHL